MKKFKYASAIDAFRKLKNDPSAQLLDIRDNQSLSYLRSPNLKILNKIAVPVEFVEGEDERFVKKALANFSDPGNTILCILDKYDNFGPIFYSRYTIPNTDSLTSWNATFFINIQIVPLLLEHL